MKVILKKSSVPIIWLDTNVLIDLTRLKYSQTHKRSNQSHFGRLGKLLSLLARGESLKRREKRRAEKLHDVLYTKTRQRQLICPMGDQREEYGWGNDEAHRLQTSLSMGIKFRHRSVIQQRQIIQVAKAHLQKKENTELSYVDAFEEDPGRLLKKGGPIISVHLIPSGILLAKWKELKREKFEHMESLKRETIRGGVTYEQQLEIEYTFGIHALLAVLERWSTIQSSGTRPTIWDYIQFEDVVGPVNELTGYTGSLEETLNFILSDDYKSIPYIDISCRLFADNMTSNIRLEASDSMDIEQLSAVIPYCDIVLTDEKRKNQIKKLGIDTDYGTKIYSLRDIDILLADLERITSRNV